MKEIFQSKSFWIVAIISTFVIFVALLNLSRTYVSQTDTLIIPRSASAIANSEQIIENLGALPRSLSFYEKMVGENEDLSDEFVEELPAYKKKAYWESKVKTQNDPKSGIVRVLIADEDSFRAEILSDQAAKTLLAVASLYYDIKTDIDIRIIDGPITNDALSKNIFILILESLAGGFFITFFSFFATFYLFPEKKSEEEIPRWFSPGNLKTFQGRTFETPKAEPSAKIFPKEEKPWTPEKIPTAGRIKKAAAPDNLPVAEDSEPVLNVNPLTESPSKDSDSEQSKEETPIIREATPEEVKERLNKLLSGKLQ